MASWKVPGSILETPGVDFGGSGDDFFEIFNSFFDAFSKYCLQGSLQHALHETLESLSHLLFEEAENLLRTCRVAGHLPANFQPAYPHYVGPRSAKWVGGGGSPPGGLQSAAHRRCGNGVLDHSSSSRKAFCKLISNISSENSI